MKHFILFGICCLFALQGVGQGTTVKTRIALPAGFTRINVKEGSFEEYLRNLPLRPRGSKVYYYDGREKRDTRVYCAVVDMEIGKRDLQQCADAVIRLRAEYLYKQKAYNKIHFNFTNGFRADYTKWAEGYQISERKSSFVVQGKGSGLFLQDFPGIFGHCVRLCRNIIAFQRIEIRADGFHADRGRVYSRRITRSCRDRGGYGGESRYREKIVFAGTKLYASSGYSDIEKSGGFQLISLVSIEIRRECHYPGMGIYFFRFEKV